ncbi:hypothetical protein SCOR_08820 [Sulfidibacter corallicola]|uniref:Uncharacterized protein n=1 Tax=Sulfidibacter corallicola TaxID=2818388 RepID=A0A8A4TNL3_SULCO|nr:hypothetical protein [Sulfidibacter corallicola]QTD51140.1 hypothetical protein J3U87_01615 [Sulfidibacter corallicola]
MSTKVDPEVKAGELIGKMDTMIKEAEALVRQTDEFYQELGIERDAAKRYLESDKVPQAERERILAELAEWEEEVAREIKEAQDRFKNETTPRRSKARIPRMRI